MSRKFRVFQTVQEKLKFSRNQFFEYSFNRLDDCCFGRPNKVIEFKSSTQDVFSNSIVDDSNYVPNSNYIRSKLSSGQPFSKGVYDFPDGKDNGYNPELRSLDVDLSDVDAAVNSIIDDVKSKQSKKQQEEQSKKIQERQEKILTNLENLPNNSSAESSE